MSGQGLSLDTLFGSGQPEQPKDQSQGLSLDTVLGPDPKNEPVKSGPAFDSYFGLGSIGRTLDAFGQGLKSAWGSENLGLSPETDEALKKYGVFNDYKKGDSSIIKATNEALIRPAAVALDAVSRASSGVFAGGQAAVHQGLLEEGAPESFASDVAAMPEAFMGTPHPMGIPEAPHPIAQARSLGVIGEGEGGYFGTVEAKPETLADRAQATKEHIKALQDQEPPAGTPEGADGQPSIATPPSQAPTDIHAVARQVAPETFQEYDALTANRDLYRSQIQDMAEQRNELPEAKAAQARIDDILGKVNGVEDRLTNAAATRLEAARSDLDDALSKDTPEMAEARKNLLAADYRMRDLAPDVANAYRRAQDSLPEAEGENVSQTASEPVQQVPERAETLEPAVGGELSRPISESVAEGTKEGTAEAAGAGTFTTAKGSTYVIHEDGTTTRNKAARPDAGHEGDSGPKERSVKTVYTDNPDDASALSAAGLQGMPSKGARVIIKDGKASLLIWNEKAGKWGVSPSSRDIPISTEPGIGKAPLELWKPANDVPGHAEAYRGMHAGNAITELKKTPKATQQGGTSIASDVASKLVAAGRPAEEADAASAIIQAHYEARAARFGGAKGTAAEMYAREAPDIRSAGRKRAVEMAQGKTLHQARRGSLTIGDARNTIKLFKDADASTFLHETGHQWLEELMGDAKDEQAPDDIRKDAQTVRDWYNKTRGKKAAWEGDAIPTAAHEQWARGFERYLMEGVAPSRALAKVFAQFRDWLTKIYQSVNRLRSPINDDIRDVFDRLIAINPERTVIAPERVAETMADLHEVDARTTPPEKAAEVRDNIEEEIDTLAKQQIPEVAHELAKSETGEQSAPVTGTGDSGDEAWADAGSSVAAEEPAAQSEGSNETQPEGGDVRAEPSQGGGNPARVTRPTEQPTGPNERFAEPESDLIDKAGNIVLANLNTPEEINEVLRETAATNGDFMAARRGVISDGETLDLADALGMDPAFLNRRKIGQAFNAEQIIAARKLLIQSAKDVRDAMKDAASKDDVASLIAYATVKDRHRMIQEHVSGITAEAGRALRAFRNMEGMADAKAVSAMVEQNTGRTLNQLRKEAKLGQTLQTPAQVSKFINDTWGKKFRSMIIEYYVNTLISGPITHSRYAVGNAIQAIWSGGVVTPIAAGIGSVKNALGLVSEGDRVYFGEVGAQMLGMTKGSADGWRAGYAALKSGVSEPLPGERFSPHYGQAQQAIPGIVGKAIRIPGKSVSGIHSFFKSLRYEQNMQSLAYRTAMKEGLNGEDFNYRVADLTMRPSAEMMEAWEDRESYAELESALSAKNIARAEGLSGDAMAERISNLVANPTPEMKTDLDSGKYTDTARKIAENAVSATKESLRELYMSPTVYGSTMGFLNRAINSSLVGKIIVPFMKIGSQITRNAFLEMTPLGILDKDIRANLKGENGGAAQDMQLARMTAGVALSGITVQLAAMGLATGDGPQDPSARREWLLRHRPNTITVGDISVPYQGLGSIGMLMRFSANMYATAHGIDGDTAGKMGIGFLEGASKSVLDENFMRGVKDLLDAVYHPEEYGEGYIKDFVTNWLPYSVGLRQVAMQVDPYKRDTKGADLWDSIGKSVTAHIPYRSETLKPTRDVFGEPIPSTGSNMNYANDPVVQEMDRLQIWPGKLERKIRSVPLTEEQYDDYSRIAGRQAKMRLNLLVGMPGFQSIPDANKFDMIKSIFASSREGARSTLMMQNPEIMHQAMEAKLIPFKRSLEAAAH